MVGAALATFATGCMDLDAPVPEASIGSADNAIQLSPCDPTEESNGPLLCGWQNGAQDWFNLFQKASQTEWLNQAGAPPVLQSWEKPWTNDWEGTGTNSYAIGWTRVWDAAWPNWNFNGSGFAWALKKGADGRGTFVGNGCAHPTSQTGDPLQNGCNEVVRAVCAEHPSCCGIRERIEISRGLVRDIRIPRFGSWDAGCVASAVSLSEPDARYWAHSVMDTGASLPNAPRWHDYVLQQSGFTAGLVGGINMHGYWEPTNECAKKVCDSGNDSCCTTAWTSTCVEQAFNLCSARYTANTRIESQNVPTSASGQPDPARPQIDRVFADVCYEATVPGFNACPVDRTERNGGKECCRRALVLQGAYRAIDTTSSYGPDDPAHYGHGRVLDWAANLGVRLNRSLIGDPYPVSVTMAPDPCFKRAGVTVCLPRKHKLWQAAGPGGPLYPDYPESGAAVAPPNPLAANDCSQNIKAQFERCADWTHQHQGFRSLLMAAVSALITTDASHHVDFRWRPDYILHDNVWMEYSEQSPAPFIDQYTPIQLSMATFDTWEGNWGTRYEAGHLVTSASCYGANAPQRAHGDLVMNIPDCNPADRIGLIQSLFEVPPVVAQ
jgi:hypothetical protein